MGSSPYLAPHSASLGVTCAYASRGRRGRAFSGRPGNGKRAVQPPLLSLPPRLLRLARDAVTIPVQMRPVPRLPGVHRCCSSLTCRVTVLVIHIFRGRRRGLRGFRDCLLWWRNRRSRHGGRLCHGGSRRRHTGRGGRRRRARRRGRPGRLLLLSATRREDRTEHDENHQKADDHADDPAGQPHRAPSSPSPPHRPPAPPPTSASQSHHHRHAELTTGHQCITGSPRPHSVACVPTACHMGAIPP